VFLGGKAGWRPIHGSDLQKRFPSAPPGHGRACTLRRPDGQPCASIRTDQPIMH